MGQLKRLSMGLLALAAVACGVPAQAEKDQDPSRARVLSLTKRVSEADNAFGMDMLGRLLKDDKEKNIFISPLSIGMALHMTYNGAGGDTAKEMGKVMHVPDVALSNLNEGNKFLRDSLMAENKRRLDIANAIFARKGEDFSEDFMNRVRKYFAAQVQTLDFADPASVEIINKWCADNTNQKIKQVIDRLSPEDRMWLINAVYFKADWKFKFDKEKTKDGDFHTAPGKSVKVPLMRQRMDLEGFMGDDFMAGRLPYADGRTAMYLFVPDAIEDLPKLMERVTPENWAQWRGKFAKREDVSVILPRFKVEYEKSLVETLKAIGMKRAFSDGADFGGMRSDGRRDLFIGEVIHKTFVEVNEEGTEAAAVTAVGVRATSVGPRREFMIHADKPFFYAICDEMTGAILFMGVMRNPAQ